LETIWGTIASAARPLRDIGGPCRPHKERKDTGEDGYVQRSIRFSCFGCEPSRFMLVSPEHKTAITIKTTTKNPIRCNRKYVVIAGTVSQFSHGNRFTEKRPLLKPLIIHHRSHGLLPTICSTRLWQRPDSAITTCYLKPSLSNRMRPRSLGDRDGERGGIVLQKKQLFLIPATAASLQAAGGFQDTARPVLRAGQKLHTIPCVLGARAPHPSRYNQSQG